MPKRLINRSPSKDAIYGDNNGASEPVPVEGAVGAVSFGDGALHNLASVTTTSGYEALSLVVWSIPYAVTTTSAGTLTFTLRLDGSIVDQVVVDLPDGVEEFRDIYNRNILLGPGAGSHVYLTQIQSNGGVSAGSTEASPAPTRLDVVPF